MQSLLSQAESSVIQSFLSSMDYTDDHMSASEWALFSGHAPEYTTNDDLLDPMANPENKDALTKATKDLMSLDSDRWSTNDSSSMMNHQQLQQQQTSSTSHFDARGQILTYNHHHHPTNHIHPHQSIHHSHVSFNQGGTQNQTSQDVFPFLHSKPQQQQGIHYSMSMQQHPLSLSTLNTSSSDQPLSAGSSMTPTTPISPFAFPPNHHHLSQHQHHQQQHHHLQQQQQALHQHVSRQQSSFQPPQLQIQTRQNGTHNTHASPSTSSPPPSTLSGSSSRSTTVMSPTGSGTSATINGKTRRGTSPRTNNGTGATSSNGSVASGQAKQTLLSPSQKKANHIQSEQKRRANIRRGYEALCETVPALREAIREEEETERRMRAGIGPGPGARKKTRGKKGKDGDEKEKVDGRAGPRSENVVLSKTIDHIQYLLADRSELLARLHHARSSLPPGHPALTPLIADPPWEREWKGGDGRLGDEENEDGMGDDDGSDDDV